MCYKYNGWTNYETWSVKLWMNDGGNEYFNEMAQGYYDSAEANEYLTKEQVAICALAEQLEAYHEELLPELECGFIIDLLNNAFSKVNWHEIAENLMEQVDKVEDTEAIDA